MRPWRAAASGGVRRGKARRFPLLSLFLLLLGACTLYRTPVPAPTLAVDEGPLALARVALDLRAEPGEGRVHFHLRNGGEAPAKILWEESRFLYPDGTREPVHREEWGRWLTDGLRPETVVPPGHEARGAFAPASGRGQRALDLGPTRGGGVTHTQLVVPYQRTFSVPVQTIRLLLVMEVGEARHEFEVPLGR